MHHVTKIVSWWNIDCMVNFLLDSDPASGTNVEATEAIDASSTKIDSSIDEVPKKIMSSVCGDAGRGGFRERIENEMMKQGRT